MGWRTVYIQSASHLSLNLDNMQVKYQLQKYNVNLEEIDTVIIEDYKCTVTVRLLSKFCELGINVIFTKMNNSPIGALHGFDNNSRTAKVSRNQINLKKPRQKNLWKQIIVIKILLQDKVLSINGKESNYLKEYAASVKSGDITNREGLAARDYFRLMFGNDFLRFSDDIVNFSLNYVYQVIRSKIAQAVIDRGLHPSFGIFHKGEYNYFNLADDLIEPYRPIADHYIYTLLKNYKKEYLTPELKEDIIKVLNYKVSIGKKTMSVVDSIKIYMNNILDFYNLKTDDLVLYPGFLDE